MLFRVEHIPHRNRTLKGKCRACSRHSTFKIKLHKLKAVIVLKPEYCGKHVITKQVAEGDIFRKEYVPIGNKPYLLCSKQCVVLAQLKFL